MILDQFLKEEINSIQVHQLKTHKYKTNTIVVNIVTDLTEENVTKVALLPYILKRGSKQFPTLKQIQEKLDHLYGARLDAFVFKRGERQIVQFSCEVANEKYLNENGSLLSKAIHLLGNLITQPFVVDQGFHLEIFESEKELLAQRIKSILDDKIQYAEQKMIENMCKDEPYRLPADGRIEDLDQITKENLYQFYHNWITTSRIDFFIIGNYDESIVHSAISKFFLLPKRQVNPLARVMVDIPIKEEKIAIEELDVKQGKLNIGLRTYTTMQDEDYIPMLVFNGVLGGFAHSKLFVNVREKSSLAYYVASRLDSHKGIMTIQSGIEIQNYDKTVEIIKEQIQLMKEGKITDQEMDQTKAILSNQLKEMLDRPRQLIDFAYQGILSGTPRILSQMIEQIKNVTIDDLVRVGQKVKIDTIYFLRDHVKEEA
ncbi:EF-P 5-aminopentanol modification-associated protein YfmF [Tepidibacillus fermentans]|uniref:Putative Zn-dependent peptidase n=1 Tax=Tepidibacillus fermentans TaxID=1281767 RepID=A0A4V2USW0_9BACI|nr:pitrilysin family protein [Tepidibacillus fermentans]TCS83013.1 putative Zn-dependent peptidase [Tepidibacillus fermentans]